MRREDWPEYEAYEADLAASLAAGIEAASQRRTGVSIGSRWQPTHGYFRDTDSGVYAERNPPAVGYALALQKALLGVRGVER